MFFAEENAFISIYDSQAMYQIKRIYMGESIKLFCLERI